MEPTPFYVVSYERIAVRAYPGAPWQWFDGPITFTLRHYRIAHAVFEEQAQRATAQYGQENCHRIILRAYGQEVDIDWTACLASVNATDRRQQSA